MHWSECDAGVAILSYARPLGDRDTFSCQERARLKAVVLAAVANSLSEARQLERTSNAGTFWQREPERRELWQAVRRCLEFLDVATQAENALPKGGGVRLQGIVEQYIKPGGGGGWTERSACSSKRPQFALKMTRLRN